LHVHVHVIGEDEFCFLTFRGAFFTSELLYYYYYGGRRRLRHRVTHWPPLLPTSYTVIVYVERRGRRLLYANSRARVCMFCKHHRFRYCAVYFIIIRTYYTGTEHLYHDVQKMYIPLRMWRHRIKRNFIMYIGIGDPF